MARKISTDAAILSALRQQPGGISGEDLSEKLGISRAAIWARIEDLRKLGYDIAASPHGGYRLVSCPDCLHADDLMARLGDVRAIGRDIQVFQETTSTNDVVDRLARDGVAEGVAVFAETQTKGRGRLGRKWISPPRKGLWFSVLLRPNLLPQNVTQIIVASATSLARAIQLQTGLKPEIKWPNDILIKGRKVAGILTELSGEVERVHHVVLGIGLDANVAASDLPAELRNIATSLLIESGQEVNRAELAVEILRQLDADYTRIHGGGFEELAQEWAARCTTLGSQVTIQTGERIIQGRAESLDPDGSLLVRTPHGRLERVVGGDVQLAR